MSLSPVVRSPVSRDRRRASPAQAPSLLTQGDNCWCVATAEAASIIWDAQAYFAILCEAFKRATRTVFIIGWDIHSETPMRGPLGARGDAPEQTTLVELLESTIHEHPELEVRILIWDHSLLFTLEREASFMTAGRLARHPQIEFALDAKHPIGGSHHQKLVVIDDKLAFSGGIDLTVARSDTADHPAHSPLRRLPDGEPYGPMHDIQLAVSGPAAAKLGELARRRWSRATGKSPPPPLDHPLEVGDIGWPSGLSVDFRHVEVAISRTAPHLKHRGARSEVHQLYLDLIAAAEDWIYIENQYLTAESIRDALSERLAEPDGPEIVIIAPHVQSGALEQNTMGVLRAAWVRTLRAADKSDRLRVLCPSSCDDPSVFVNVHAKVMCVDDKYLRVGSANLNNRSMALDSECDLTITAGNCPETRHAIVDAGARLVAHHLGISAEEWTAERRRCGSAVGALDALAQRTHRVVPLDTSDVPAETMLSNQVLDPIQPLDDAVAQVAMPKGLRRLAQRRTPLLLGFMGFLLLLAALWAWSPMRQWVAPAVWVETLDGLRGTLVGPLLFAAIVCVATLLMVPITLLIVIGTILFGPVVGGLASLAGGMVSAAVGHRWGGFLLPAAAERRLGGIMGRVSRAFARGGVLSVLALRLVPIAPYTVVNIAAGSAGVRMRDFLIGTALGLLPGLIALSVAADRIIAAIESPTGATIAIAVAAVVVMAGGLIALTRFLRVSPGGDAGAQAASGAAKETPSHLAK